MLWGCGHDAGKVLFSPLLHWGCTTATGHHHHPVATETTHDTGDTIQRATESHVSESNGQDSASERAGPSLVRDLRPDRRWRLRRGRATSGKRRARGRRERAAEKEGRAARAEVLASVARRRRRGGGTDDGGLGKGLGVAVHDSGSAERGHGHGHGPAASVSESEMESGEAVVSHSKEVSRTSERATSQSLASPERPTLARPRRYSWLGWACPGGKTAKQNLALGNQARPRPPNQTQLICSSWARDRGKWKHCY
jgi:hypothetical protein